MKNPASCIAVVLMATGWVGAQTTTVWNPAANGVFPPAVGDWSDGANWTGSIDPNTGPDGGDGSFKCVFNVPGAADCVLSDIRSVDQVVIGDNGPGGKLTVESGGILSQRSTVWFGVGFNDEGAMDIQPGAIVNTGQHLWVGFEPSGTGTVNLNGGTINVGQQFGLGWNGGTGFFNANEGVANLTEIHPSLSIRGSSVLDVRWATVTIIGDHTGSVNGYAANNFIRAFDGDGTLNVSFDGGLNRTIITATHPMNPSPGFDETVLAGNVDLSWTNLEPNSPGDPVFVDVFFHTDPNKLGATKVVSLGENTTSVQVSAPTVGTFYWWVDSYIFNTTDPETVIEGDLFRFNTTNDAAPTVVIDTPDTVTWVNQPVQLNATVTDDDASALSYSWTADAPGVSFSDANVEDPTVTIDNAAGPVTLTLTVGDVLNVDSDSDVVVIEVYNDACEAARLGADLADDFIVDTDTNCIVNMLDFVAELASKWLDDYALTAPVPVP